MAVYRDNLSVVFFVLIVFVYTAFYIPRVTEAQNLSPEPGYLGIVGDDRATKDQGVRIVKVIENSPADRGWLREGDMIIGLENQPIHNAAELNKILKTKKAGDNIKFRINRSGRINNRAVTLGKRPQSKSSIPLGKITAPKQTQKTYPQKPKAVLGVITSPITGDVARHLGISVRSGALVEHVFQHSAAEKAGLRVPSVIVEVAGAAINNPLELAHRIEESQVGEKVEIAFYFRGRLFRTDVKLDSSIVKSQEIPLEKITPKVDQPILSNDQQRIRLLERENSLLKQRIEQLESNIQR